MVELSLVAHLSGFPVDYVCASITYWSRPHGAAGIIQLSKALALEWARCSIRVNALPPGHFATDLNDKFFATGKALVERISQRHPGRLEELNRPLLRLTPDAESFMTGRIVAIDGCDLVSRVLVARQGRFSAQRRRRPAHDVHSRNFSSLVSCSCICTSNGSMVP